MGIENERLPPNVMHVDDESSVEAVVVLPMAL